MLSPLFFSVSLSPMNLLGFCTDLPVSLEDLYKSGKKERRGGGKERHKTVTPCSFEKAGAGKKRILEN